MKRYIVQSRQGLEHMASQVMKFPRHSTDAEFHTADWVTKPGLVGWSFTVKEKTGQYLSWYVPMDHKPRPESRLQNISQQIFLPVLKRMSEPDSVTKICHAAEIESGLAKQYGIEFGDNIDDTMIEAWLVDENKYWEGGLYPFRLKELADKVLGRKLDKLKALVAREIGEQAKSKDPSHLSIEEGALYGTNDTLHTYMLDEWFKPHLESEAVMEDYRRIEIPLVRVLRDMVRTGIVIDTELATAMHEAIVYKQQKLEENAFKISGEQFNLNSRKQLGRILFEKLGYPPHGMTSGGKKGKPQYKTSDDVMQLLANEGYELAVTLREYGDLTKVDGTYVAKLMANRIYHPSFWQCGTVTGRYSSDFQQVPRPPNSEAETLFLEQPKLKQKIGIIIRRLITCEDDEWLICGDFNQLELRLLAHFTADPILIGCYQRGEDLHDGTAQEIRAAAAEALKQTQSVTKWLQFPRQDAKPWNFGLVYGLMENACVEAFGEVMGPIVYRNLNKRFGGMMKSREAFIHQTHVDGFIRTLFWRKRRLPEINSGDWFVEGHAERQSFNVLIQGTAADVVKLAQIALYRKIPEARQCLQVHDELLFRFKGAKKHALECAKEIKHVMENVVKLSVPLRADPGVGKNWLEAK